MWGAGTSAYQVNYGKRGWIRTEYEFLSKGKTFCSMKQFLSLGWGRVECRWERFEQLGCVDQQQPEHRRRKRRQGGGRQLPQVQGGRGTGGGHGSERLQVLSGMGQDYSWGNRDCQHGRGPLLHTGKRMSFEDMLCYVTFPSTRQNRLRFHTGFMSTQNSNTPFSKSPCKSISRSGRCSISIESSQHPSKSRSLFQIKCLASSYCS